MPHYTKKEIEKQCLEIIDKYNCTTVDEIFGYSLFCSKTFYNHKIHKLQAIKTALQKNVSRTKNTLRGKLFASTHHGAHIALLKLLGTDEEYYRLANAELKIKNKGETKIIVQDGTEHGII